MRYKNKYSSDIIIFCGLNNENELMFTYDNSSYFSLSRAFIAQYYEKFK